MALAHLDPHVEVLDPVEMQFCFVPRGEFWLGSGDEDEIAYDDEKTKGRSQQARKADVWRPGEVQAFVQPRRGPMEFRKRERELPVVTAV